jgi:hypothetical protein
MAKHTFLNVDHNQEVNFKYTHVYDAELIEPLNELKEDNIE